MQLEEKMKGKELEAILVKKKEISGFNDFIESNYLVDVSIVGKKYTWFKSNGISKSILDRFLVS